MSFDIQLGEDLLDSDLQGSNSASEISKVTAASLNWVKTSSLNSTIPSVEESNYFLRLRRSLLMESKLSPSESEEGRVGWTCTLS